MAKQTKNKITREFVLKELLFYNGAKMKSGFVMLGVFALVWVPAVIGFVLTVGKAQCFLWGGLFLLAAYVPVYTLIRCFLDRAALKRDSFDVFVREVSYKSEELLNRRLVEYLHFPDFNKVSPGHTVYQLADVGDAFYLVVYRSGKEVVLLYHTDMYEYTEK